MHAFYSNFKPEDKLIYLSEEEMKHFRVLRIKDDEKIAVTNGTGLFAICLKNKNNNNLEIIDIIRDHNENNYIINLFCGIIQDKNKIEFIVEKATELGANKIIFFPATNSQKIKLNMVRLEKKAIGAMKQSNRSILPKIFICKNINQIKNFTDNKFIYLADKNTKNKNINGSEINLFIGPEAGFSEIDLRNLGDNFLINKVNLGNAILRTETAAIAMMVRANGN